MEMPYSIEKAYKDWSFFRFVQRVKVCISAVTIRNRLIVADNSEGLVFWSVTFYISELRNSISLINCR